MRRHHWLLAAVVLVALFAWTQRPRHGALQAPPGEIATAPVATAPATRSVDANADRAARTDAARAAASAADYPDFLPREAHAVLDAIARGGPHAYPQDGRTFHNRERRLPPQPRGHYREFTVDTPGSGDRGARRIVTGGTPPTAFWYTDDHYRSFRAFEWNAAARDDGARR